MSATWMLRSFATKRKRWSNSETADASRPAKRCRHSTLERGFAHLSLDGGGPGIAEDVEDVEMPMEADASTPSSDVNDVKMRKSTWYERERDRIVVTELETSSDEETDRQESGGGLYVSPALLKHIRSHTQDSSLKRSTSQALVLYQPSTISVDIADGDAMDLEP